MGFSRQVYLLYLLRCYWAFDYHLCGTDSILYNLKLSYFSTFQFNSVTELCLAHCNSMDCSMPGFPVHYQILEPAKTHVHQVSGAIQANYPLSSIFNPAFNFPNISVFSNESILYIRWQKHCSFSFSISPSNEYSGLISFGNDWLDILAFQGTLKSLLEHHSSKTWILWCSAFFMVQLSHP